jgi:hypothetical protein
MGTHDVIVHDMGMFSMDLRSMDMYCLSVHVVDVLGMGVHNTRNFFRSQKLICNDH